MSHTPGSGPPFLLQQTKKITQQKKNTRKDVMRVRPMCFGNGGTWKPIRLNECFKFGRYPRGGHFAPHIDGPWVPRCVQPSLPPPQFSSSSCPSTYYLSFSQTQNFVFSHGFL